MSVPPAKKQKTQDFGEKELENVLDVLEAGCAGTGLEQFVGTEEEKPSVASMLQDTCDDAISEAIDKAIRQTPLQDFMHDEVIQEEVISVEEAKPSAANLLQDLDDITPSSFEDYESAVFQKTEAIFNTFDADNNGVIEGDEYTACVDALLAHMKGEFERELRKAIDRSGCNADKDVVFRNFMEHRFDEADMRRRVVEMVDPNQDGKITKMEALAGFKKVVATIEADVYPADFGWAPDWDEEATGKRNPLFFETFVSVAEADWVHSSMQMDFDEEVAFKIRRKLRQIGSTQTSQLHSGCNSETQPFFLVASFTEPHDPYSGPKEFWDWYEGVDIDMPQVPFIPRAERDPHSQRVYDCMDNGDFDITDQRITKSRRAYYSMMSYIDSKIGEIIRTLDEQGLRDDTLIVFTADHGDMLGERGMWFKETYHERATRVPLFFSATPALVAKYDLGLKLGQTVTHNVSHADLLPTFIHLALKGGVTADWKADLPSPVEGRSLLPSLLGTDFELENGVIYCEYTSEMIPGGWFMVKKGALKLIYSEKAPLLFDLIKDPNEMNNIAESKQYESPMADLMELARAKWPDLADLNRKILISQRQRRFVHAASLKGKRTHWDFEPVEDPNYPLGIRNTIHSLQDQEYVRRAPYRGKRPRN